MNIHSQIIGITVIILISALGQWLDESKDNRTG